MGRREILLSGRGPIQDVTDALTDTIDDESPALHDLLSAVYALKSLLSVDETRHIALVTACAVVNSEFRESHYLMSVETSGRLHINIENDSSNREMLADAMGL